MQWAVLSLPESVVCFSFATVKFPLIVTHDNAARINIETQITATSPTTGRHFLHLEERELPYELTHDPHNGPQCPWRKQALVNHIPDDHTDLSL